ncbi:LOW QUALITY PROTEIN: fibroblast growth factor 1 [Anomaloglossus baeobatrachus]|uniref:LOW QUALITY PROTEIN: fibroblast growth factor 1 n=1 Tax=Anomaloglossus baeobatrachus TaxID=238106 RepID=UPI003F5022AA
MAEGIITTLYPMTEKFNLLMRNYKKPKLLYCNNGGYILVSHILPDGVVDGTRDKDDLNIILIRIPPNIYVPHLEHVNMTVRRTRELSEVALLVMTLNEECMFLETVEENSYNTYKWKKYSELNWFVGIKKNGTSKPRFQTHYGQKAILFLLLLVSKDEAAKVKSSFAAQEVQLKLRQADREAESACLQAVHKAESACLQADREAESACLQADREAESARLQAERKRFGSRTSS